MSAGETDLIASLAVWKAQAITRLTTLEAVLAAAVEMQTACSEKAKANRAAQKSAALSCEYEAAGVYRGRAEVYEEIHDALAAAVGKAKGE